MPAVLLLLAGVLDRDQIQNTEVKIVSVWQRVRHFLCSYSYRLADFNYYCIDQYAADAYDDGMMQRV